MKNQLIKTVTLSILASSLALGANLSSVPSIGDIERQIKTPNIPQEKQVLPELNIKKEYKAPMSDNGKTILVKDFIFSGNNHISSTTLDALIKEFKNKELTFTQITELTSLITKYYREKGYFVARAYLPTQDIKNSDNVLEITIIEGSYGEFKLNNNSLVKDSVVQGILDNVKKDNVISNSTLERAMLIINDTPGVKVSSADVKPGALVGTSDFIIATEKTNRVDGYVLADNIGSRYTGKNRLMAGLNINSPFNIGDKIALSGLVSNGTDLRNARVAYSAPLASNGLLGEISYSQTEYSLEKEYKSLDAHGTAKTVDANLIYPLIRSSMENLYLRANVEARKLEDKIDLASINTKKDSKAITLGTDYNKEYTLGGFNLLSKINFNFKYGNLEFANDSDKKDDELGANTNGDYSKVNLDIVNVIGITNNLTLDTALKMQYALGNKNLDGSEDFSIGGAYGVKLYPDGELSAENGYVLNLELKYALPNISKLSNSVGVFYDRGRVTMADNKKVDFQAKSIQDMGLGYYASYDKLFGQVQVAWNVNSKDITSEPNRNSRVLFQAGMVF